MYKVIRYSFFILGLTQMSFAIDNSFTTGFFTDWGRIESGIGQNEGGFFGSGKSLDKLILQRTGAFVSYNESFSDGFGINVTLGALFWKSYNELGGGLLPGGAYFLHSGLGVSSISFTQQFTSNLNLSFGLLNYKYNSQAKNLGEYLLTSDAYPTVIRTGGWSWLNAASYDAPGVIVQWNWFKDILKHDFLLLAEYQNVPFFDISPSYVLTLNLKIIQAGIGYSYDRLFREIDHSTPLNDPVYIYDTNAVGIVDSLELTFQAQKIVSFVHVNIAEMLKWDEIKTGPLGIYGELALLGFRNFFDYYESIKDRLPIMAGINIPTFGVLDLLSVEFEYLKNPNLNSIQKPVQSARPLKQVIPTKYTRDDWQWSIYAKKSVLNGVELLLQVANDHQRLSDNLGRSTELPITLTAKDWYWLFRFQWVI